MVADAGASADGREALAALLRDDYALATADDGAAAILLATDGEAPDLIVLPADAPGVDNLAVCRSLMALAATQDIPVLFTLAKHDAVLEARCFEAGGADCLVQPYQAATVHARVRLQLAMLDSAKAQATTIFALMSLAEMRDSGTGNHILRIQGYVKILAQRLKRNPRFAALLTRRYINHLCQAAPLHDMGAIGIPDRVLLKPGSLTTTEFNIMKTHAALARDAIESAQNVLGADASLLTMAREMAYSHQEKWDGSGYPQGLAGDQIPVSARIMAIADVYDALISQRVYKDGLPHVRAVQEIFQGRDSHFDPDMVDAFIEIQDEFNVIARRYADSEQDLQRKIEYLANAIAETAY
jgi:putative two-component system response regulator